MSQRLPPRHLADSALNPGMQKETAETHLDRVTTHGVVARPTVTLAAGPIVDMGEGTFDVSC